MSALFCLPMWTDLAHAVLTWALVVTSPTVLRLIDTSSSLRGSRRHAKMDLGRREDKIVSSVQSKRVTLASKESTFNFSKPKSKWQSKGKNFCPSSVLETLIQNEPPKSLSKTKSSFSTNAYRWEFICHVMFTSRSNREISMNNSLQFYT